MIVTNCSNNYGPYQFPEKLIRLATLRASAGAAYRLERLGKRDQQ